MYLVDTNVISALAPTKDQPNAELSNWIMSNSALLYLSVITIAEIEDGIANAQHKKATRKAHALREWLETVLHLYSQRILPIDIPVARDLGHLASLARAAGHAPGLADLAIAATAHCNGYTVLTRNLRHFRILPVPVHDPFLSLPTTP